METNQQPKRIFKPIDLTKAIKIATKQPEKVSKKRIIKTAVKKSKSYKEEEITINQDTILTSQDSSVQKYLNECHPDVIQFIKDNHACTFTAKAEGLVIVTRNGLRISITTISAEKRKVVITDKKKNVLFNDTTIVQSKAAKK